MRRVLLTAIVVIGVAAMASTAMAANDPKTHSDGAHPAWSYVVACGLTAISNGEVICPVVDASGNAKVTALRYGYNGTAFEETQHNLDLTLLASAARTVTTDSADQTNRNGRGVLVTVDVTAITLTPVLTPNIQCKDVLSGKYENLLTASVTITATGTHTYMVYPGVGAASGDVTQVAGFPLCRTWRVSITHGDTDSATYSVGASLVQ